MESTLHQEATVEQAIELGLRADEFEMIKKIAGALKMDKLKKWKMEPFQASFTIDKGNVTVKPFKTKVGNYTAEIGGQNGLDKSINYAITFI
jgi:hypothetical protein